jgi:hypothetical protein
MYNIKAHPCINYVTPPTNLSHIIYYFLSGAIAGRLVCMCTMFKYVRLFGCVKIDMMLSTHTHTHSLSHTHRVQEPANPIIYYLSCFREQCIVVHIFFLFGNTFLLVPFWDTSKLHWHMFNRVAIEFA